MHSGGREQSVCVCSRFLISLPLVELYGSSVAPKHTQAVQFKYLLTSRDESAARAAHPRARDRLAIAVPVLACDVRSRRARVKDDSN